MKGLLPYIVVFVAATVAAVLVFVVIGLVSPAALNLATDHNAPADSTGTPHAAGTDAKSDSAVTSADSVATAENVAAAPPEQKISRQVKGTDSSRTALASDSLHRSSPTTSIDSVRIEERKSLAKVFEAMEPERAAKILKEIPDDQVREVILALKKRQAAKILGALEPTRAARIMR